MSARSGQKDPVTAPHPALIEIVAGRPVGGVGNEQAMIDSAIEHRLGGFCFWAESQGLVDISAGGRRQLARIKLATAAHNAQTAAVAAAVIGELETAGFAGAVFKGVATEQRWYPESGTRPGADIDLMLAPTHWAGIDDVIALLAPGHPLAGRAARLFATGRIQSVDFERDDIWIDLHTDPIKVGVALAGMGHIWDRVEPLTINGADLVVLDASTSLIQAAVHLQKDRFSRLSGYVDVARIACSGDVDWRWVQNFVTAAGLHVHLNEALRVVSETLGIAIPYDRRVASRVWRAIWPERTRLRGEVGLTRRVRTHYWIPMTMPGRRWDAIKWWSGIVIPPRAMVEYMHPETSGPYPWRVLQYRARLARDRHRRNRQQRREGAL